MSLSTQFITSLTSGSIAAICTGSPTASHCNAQSISLAQSSVNLTFNHPPVAHMPPPSPMILLITGMALLLAWRRKC